MSMIGAAARAARRRDRRRPARTRKLLVRLSLSADSWRRALPHVLAGALLAAACSRPVDRPRDGAAPLAPGAPVAPLLPAPPPTLQPAANLLATPTPGPTTVPPTQTPVASPVRMPGVYPILSNMQPTPGSALPPGQVVIGARVTGPSNLVEVLAFVNGEPLPVPPATPPSRTTTVSFVRQLEVGTYEVRIEARDDRGQSGDQRWQFTVGPRQPPPVPTRAAPLPTFAVPTLPPLDRPLPSPAAR
jgi:hypothetical protein